MNGTPDTDAPDMTTSIPADHAATTDTNPTSIHADHAATTDTNPTSIHADHAATTEVAVLRIDPDLPMPHYAQPGDAGIDLMARIDTVLAPAGGRGLVPTGIAVALPSGYAGFILPRSGLALHHGVTCLNTPGLIDSGYRGELKVLLVNTDPCEEFAIARGERIAQLVVQAVAQVHLTEATALGGSTRGDQGFGSTGR